MVLGLLFADDLATRFTVRGLPKAINQTVKQVKFRVQFQ